MDFGQWLEKHDVGQGEAADHLECSSSTVFKIVTEGGASLRMAAKIVAMTGGEVTWDDLLPPGYRETVERIGRETAELRTRIPRT